MRISGPLLDRIDLHIEVPRLSEEELLQAARERPPLIKVARTIADLGGDTDIAPAHVAEAIQYRSLDRKLWGA